jgi:tripartite-type tricarboxylate transporter receptor subunit TctC
MRLQIRRIKQGVAMMRIALRWSLGMASLLLAMQIQAAESQAFPSRPVRVLVGFSPGSTADIFARLIGQKAAVALGQPILVDNVTGAGGSIAAAQAAKAAPDGHTMMFMGLSLVYGPALYKGLSYDPVRDFAAVSQAVNVPNALVVHPSFPARTVSELIAMAKAKPGDINYASGGTASSSQLATELFKSMAGINLREIPYKSTAQALTDTIAGQVPIYFPGLATTLSQIHSGKLRVIAVSGLSRSPTAPDIPTIAETLPGYEANAWYGFIAPAATPADRVRRLNTEIVNAVKDPEVSARIASNGAEAVGSTPQEFQDTIRTGAAKWSKLIQQLGLKAD